MKNIFKFLFSILFYYAKSGSLIPSGRKPIELGVNNQLKKSFYTFKFLTETDLTSG